MNCIVTAGPTYEPLDDVRRLTNFSTGRLGTELSAFLAGHGHHVTLLLGEMATYRGEAAVQRTQRFTTTADLRAKLKSFSRKKVHAIFHAAAVSDFTLGGVFKGPSISEQTGIKRVKKIPTRHGKLFAELLPTPKIIADLRDWFPRTIIIGWKYQADGNRADTIAAARKQIAECVTDLCVANGPAYGKGFGVVDVNGLVLHAPSSGKLFKALEQTIKAG